MKYRMGFRYDVFELKSTSRNYDYPVQLAVILSTLFVFMKVLFILVCPYMLGIQYTFLRVSDNCFTVFRANCPPAGT